MSNIPAPSFFQQHKLAIIVTIVVIVVVGLALGLGLGLGLGGGHSTCELRPSTDSVRTWTVDDDYNCVANLCQIGYTLDATGNCIISNIVTTSKDDEKEDEKKAPGCPTGTYLDGTLDSTTCVTADKCPQGFNVASSSCKMVPVTPQTCNASTKDANGLTFAAYPDCKPTTCATGYTLTNGACVPTTCATGQQKIDGKCYPVARGWYNNTVDLKSKFGVGSKSLEDCFKAADKPANADLIMYREVNNADWKNTCAAWTLDGIKSGVYGNEGGLNTQYMACVNGKDPSKKCV